MTRLLALSAALLLGALPAARGQAAPDVEVRAVIARLFTGMRTADTAMVRSTMATGGKVFARLDARATPPAVAYDTPDGWIAAIGKSGGKWDERVTGVEVRADGEIAQAWMQYTFYLDGKIRHCGTDTMELIREPAGWRITYLSDTQRREGCAEVPAGR